MLTAYLDSRAVNHESPQNTVYMNREQFHERESTCHRVSRSQFTGIGLKFFNVMAQNHTYTTHDPLAPGMDSNISIMPCFDKQAKGH
ncbi:UNVERIFIED_CONTAM: hypothetical protein FKN15_025068 [Acipenser sinensis]